MRRIDLGRKPEREDAVPLPLVERRDALPEHMTYRDEGCELAPRCLECPLPRCKYDEPGGARRLRVETRDRALIDVWRAEGLTVNELARRFGVSRRSVFRILQAARADGAARPARNGDGGPPSTKGAHP
ncbi:MAG TPA: helix-turn-helix domain-containing protein [Dehalococcoidia bacterium]|nr:helix-turn-helix domain-containing protein [Dehalococcoidia bacterium]